MTEMYNGNGIWIPFEILQNDDLTSTEKILYAEIFYLDRPDTHCTASNEYLAKFLKISEAGVKKCLTHLRELGYIYTASFDGRKRSIATSVKWRNEVDTTVSSREIQESPAEVYKNEFLLYRENKKENSRESTLPGAPSKNHSQLYKAKATLTDDLESGKSIDEQTNVKKRQTEEERADKKIDKTSYSDKVKELLKIFFRQSYYSKDVKRMKSASDLTGKLMRLDELVKKGEDPIKVVQQSIDMNWNAFYEYKEQAKAKSYSDHSDGIIAQTLSQEEAREVLKGYAERNGVV